MLHAI